jgi:Ca-activated chloride channel homolog
MEMLIFENSRFFYLFLIVPAIIVLFIVARFFQKKAFDNFGDSAVISKLIPMQSLRRPWIKMILMVFAFSMLIIAAVNPKIGSRMEEVKREGVDIVVAIDVSRSMLSEDIKPNRLERAKAAVSRLIDNLGNDRIGIVAFAGNAVTQVPITSDHSAAKMILRTISMHTVSTQGTAIGAAIERAMASFLDRELKNKTIIIISDGENHLDDPIEISKKAAEQGIVIHTIGIGTPEGGPIPVYQNKRLMGFLKDNEGNTVISRYDEQTLKSIASTTGGVFMHGVGADMGLNSVLKEIKSLEKEEYESTIFADYESRFHYFVALALIFLLLELVILERKNKWIDKIKIFKI